MKNFRVSKVLTVALTLTSVALQSLAPISIAVAEEKPNSSLDRFMMPATYSKESVADPETVQRLVRQIEIQKFEHSAADICEESQDEEHFSDAQLRLQLKKDCAAEAHEPDFDKKLIAFKIHDPAADASNSRVAVRVSREFVLTQTLPSIPTESLVKDTGPLLVLMATAAGGMIFMPESLTKWTAGSKEMLFKQPEKQWTKHFTKAPVIDKDDWTVNFVGHPMTGASYYMLARTKGHTIAQSFVYAAMMSTGWELMETFFEPISVQDFFATPIIGSLIGEMFFQLHERFGGEKEFTETVYGKLITFITNPFAGMIDGMDRTVRRINPRARISGGLNTGVSSPTEGGPKGGFFGLKINVSF